MRHCGPGPQEDSRTGSRDPALLTVARYGNVIMVLQLGDAAPVGTSTLMPEDDWWQIVQLAANRLRTALE